MAHGLLGPRTMKLFTDAAFVLPLLCGCALAASESSAQPDLIKLHFTLRDAGTARSFDVIVSSEHSCATVSEKLPSREVEIKACAVRDAHLDVEWFTRGPAGEYRSTSSLSLAHGATAELGTANGPRLSVVVQ